MQEFQSAAMRFGHTLVPPGVYRRYGGIKLSVYKFFSVDFTLVFNECVLLLITGIYSFRDAQCNFRLTSEVTGFSGHRALRTCNSYWNPQVRPNFTYTKHC